MGMSLQVSRGILHCFGTLEIISFLNRAERLELGNFISCIYGLLGCHIGFEFSETESPQVQKVFQNDFLFILLSINLTGE